MVQSCSAAPEINENNNNNNNALGFESATSYVNKAHDNKSDNLRARLMNTDEG